jgi:DNA-binding NtrC family response regulator
VNGDLVQQRVLAEDDAIEIGDFRLIHSFQSKLSSGVRHLRLAERRLDLPAVAMGHLSSKTRELPRDFSFDQRKTELLDEMQRQKLHIETIADRADDVMTALLQAVEAEKGFLGVFRDPRGEVHDEYGVINLRSEEAIEISDLHYRDRLINGQSIQESNVLLVPVYKGDCVKGFLCVSFGGLQTFPVDVPIFLTEFGKSLLSDGDVESTRRPATKNQTTEIHPWPDEMVGNSEVVRLLREQVRHATSSDTNVMILGQSGSGKEVVARMIHRQSSSSGGAFIPRNCSQVTEALAESEIFGYEAKSGISGANPAGSPGWFEMADGGTLFLDEVHGLSPVLQDKFLRVLQDREVWRIGAKRPVHVNVRVVAATDKDPELDGIPTWCRPPFLYRFGAIFRVPPLDERKDDIPLLACYFLDKHAGRLRKRTRSISHRAIRYLSERAWPGNVRELEQQIQSAVARNREVLFSWDFDSNQSSLSKTRSNQSKRSRQAPRTMSEIEKSKIEEVLDATQQNYTETARLLGYKSRQTLLNKMDRYGIPRPSKERDFPISES